MFGSTFKSQVDSHKILLGCKEGVVRDSIKSVMFSEASQFPDGYELPLLVICEFDGVFCAI